MKEDGAKEGKTFEDQIWDESLASPVRTTRQAFNTAINWLYSSVIKRGCWQQIADYSSGDK